jgi:hypothetical protein
MRVKGLVAVAAASVAILLTGVIAPGKVLAYGRADQPLAQVEVSANCDNPSYFLCQIVGTGGIWFWVEIDAGGTGDLSGAVCGHTVGGAGGPGGAGAGSIKGTATWIAATLESAPPGVPNLAVDPHDSYYLVTTPIGDQWLIPTTTGHYSFRPIHGVQIQITVAP